MWIWVAFLAVGFCLIVGVCVAAIQCATTRLSEREWEDQ